MSTQCIVQDGGVFIPLKGSRVLIKPVASLPSLAGMQMKVCVDMPHPIEGILRHVYGIGPSRDKLQSVEFHVEDDHGTTHVITRAYNPGELASVYAIVDDGVTTGA